MSRVVSILVALFATTSLMAQSVVVVDSEKIFKSISEYNDALVKLDELSVKYQAMVDERFEAVATAFNDYAAVKSGYTAAQRQSVEESILRAESNATKFQEECFSSEGVIMRTRLALIAPIQKRVFEAIEAYAKEQGADLVLDQASNPSVLYVGEKADHTQAVIKLLKRSK
ncbi:MAG: OmpH family outer membrane protein [Rikenellaceae bacterium]